MHSHLSPFTVFIDQMCCFTSNPWLFFDFRYLHILFPNSIQSVSIYHHFEYTMKLVWRGFTPIRCQFTYGFCVPGTLKPHPHIGVTGERILPVSVYFQLKVDMKRSVETFVWCHLDIYWNVVFCMSVFIFLFFAYNVVNRNILSTHV